MRRRGSRRVRAVGGLGGERGEQSLQLAIRSISPPIHLVAGRRRVGGSHHGRAATRGARGLSLVRARVGIRDRVRLGYGKPKPKPSPEPSPKPSPKPSPNLGLIVPSRSRLLMA